MRTDPKTRKGDGNRFGPDPRVVAEAHGERGAFMPDGAWYSDASHRGPDTTYLDGLVAKRRMSSISPKEMALHIAAGPHVGMFRDETLSVWARMPHAWQWPNVPTSTSAECAVKDCGYGPLRRWDSDGWCEPTQPGLFRRVYSKPFDWPSPPTDSTHEHRMDVLGFVKRVSDEMGMG